MALNQAYIMPPLQQTIFDKTLGTFLSAGKVMFFHDTSRSSPKDVYELVGSGPGSYTYVNIGSTLTLSGIGTYVDQNGGNIPIYLWPFDGTPNDQPPNTTADNYYIQVYSSTGVFQFDIPNWPGVPVGSGAGGNNSASENIISNGQFVDVLFPTTATSVAPQTFTISGGTVTTEIAPDWSIVTTGNGTINVWQIPIQSATVGIGNPAYALGISSTGFSTSLKLTQRILAPRILASTPVSATFIAQSNASNVTLSMTYTPSITGAMQTLCSGTAVSSDYSVIFNSVPITLTNPGVGTGYVDVAINIPTESSVNISCVQLCAAINNAIVGYIQETPEREVDHLFHYFQPAINFKPISSLLTGWDFALNPKQFGAVNISTTAGYVWDQTICQSVVGAVNVIQSGSGGFQFGTTNANEAVYMLQYLSGKEALLTALSRLSVNLDALASHTNVIARVYLFYGNLASTVPILPTSIGTLAANGVFTLTAVNWAAINQAPAFSNKVTLSTSFQDYGFSSFDNTANHDAIANFAIVLTFSCPTNGTNVVVQSASCVPGDIPTRPAPKTFNDTLTECQYYYEDTRPYRLTLAEMSSIANPNAGSPFAEAFASGFTITYDTIKRVNPSFTIYSQDAFSVAGNVTSTLFYATFANALKFVNTDIALLSYWANTLQNLEGITWETATLTPIAQVIDGITPDGVSHTLYNSSCQIGFYYVADARLGVI